MATKIHYGFLDESGILEKKAEEGNHFVISVVVVVDPVEIKKVMKNARKKARGKFKTHSVFHAYKEAEGFIKIILNELAKGDIEIVIGAWDKRKAKPKVSKNTLYAKLLAQTVRSTLTIYPKLNLVLHKRYNDPVIINQINEELGRSLKADQALFVDHKTEVDRRELEIADAVAWSVFQKYNRKRREFYKIIEERIKKESRSAA